jgi:hypothetical protein
MPFDQGPTRRSIGGLALRWREVAGHTTTLGLEALGNSIDEPGRKISGATEASPLVVDA